MVTEVLYRIQAIADALTTAASARMTTVYPKSVSQKAGKISSSVWESGLAKLEQPSDPPLKKVKFILSQTLI